MLFDNYVTNTFQGAENLDAGQLIDRKQYVWLEPTMQAF